MLVGGNAVQISGSWYGELLQTVFCSAYPTAASSRAPWGTARIWWVWWVGSRFPAILMASTFVRNATCSWKSTRSKTTNSITVRAVVAIDSLPSLPRLFYGGTSTSILTSDVHNVYNRRLIPGRAVVVEEGAVDLVSRLRSIPVPLYF